ncbi:MAG TPA: sugar phosphate isomerase/epimerase family protein [candidate division Zixibacteria bacterium]|nr:sugar phosphate isomerase/epimerase family protein [candidate division Zixibacteria bacterium]
MKLAFSTLACPSWSWEQSIEAARSLGYDGIEWRLISGELVDASFSAETCHRINNAMAAAGLSTCALDTSIQLAVGPGGERDSRIAEARGMLVLAEALGTDLLRVFSGEFPENTNEEQALPWIVTVLKAIIPEAERRGVRLALEVHTFDGRGKNVSGVSDSLLCRKIVDRLDTPSVGILWDVGNPLEEEETVEGTWDNVKGRLLYLHLKDMKPRPGSGWEYVATGEGKVPLGAIIRLLSDSGFQGWLSYEWEKKWHPELSEPEVALPQHIRYLKELLKQ